MKDLRSSLPECREHPNLPPVGFRWGQMKFLIGTPLLDLFDTLYYTKVVIKF